MGVTVTFDYQAWTARYPEFENVPEGVAQEYFNEAQIYHRNDGIGPVSSAMIQSVLLNMVTAHIAKRYLIQQGGQPSPDLVGRVSDASEGSVSVSTAWVDNPPGSRAWWDATKYGSDYWQATAVYRTMRYAPNLQSRQAEGLFIPGTFGGFGRSCFIG